MEWIVQRYSDDTNSTLGLLFKVLTWGKGKKLHFFCHTLEDEFRFEKVPGETRIPAGRYELKIRREDTPLTKKHRRTYGAWFKYHIEITGIPNFSNVYAHAGSTEAHTAGCLLLGFTSTSISGVQEIYNSKLAVKAWYREVYDHLDQGGQAWITFRDEKELVK